jgi:hypothetical protein
MIPAHFDKSPLKEIALRTKEKQLLQGRRYANQRFKILFGVLLSFQQFNLYISKFEISRSLVSQERNLSIQVLLRTRKDDQS